MPGRLTPLAILLLMGLTSTSLSPAATAPAATPLLAPWTGPYGGVPPFDQVHTADFKPALLAGMAEELGDYERIANNPAAATFANTIAAMERAGRPFDRANRIYSIYLDRK